MNKNQSSENQEQQPQKLFTLSFGQTHITPLNLFAAKKNPDYLEFLKSTGLELAPMAKKMIQMPEHSLNW